MRRRLATAVLAAFVTVAGTAAGGCGRAHRDGVRDHPVTVGIIDTGFTSTGPAAFVDEDLSTSVVSGDRTLHDADGHGTEMAWIVHRAAPQARVAVVKVYDAGGATTDARIAAGIEHLERAGATIVLISLAGAEPLPRTYRAIRAARGLTVYAAAGNDGLDLDHAASYPGGYRLPNLVTVAAVGRDGHLLATSNRGGTVSRHALGAIATCSPQREDVVANGTSAAAALTAGRAAAPAGADQPPTPAECAAPA